MEDIHEIKPLLSLAIPWLPLLIVTLLLLCLLVLLGWWLWRRRRRKQQAPPPPAPVQPAVPPREQALKALRALQTDLPPDRFYLQLEAILKQFLSQIHHLPVQGYTQAELLDLLRRQGHPPLDELPLPALLQRGQLAKFAQGLLPPEQLQADLQAAQDVVQRYTLRH
ncbi:MAG: DUF4381 family protein [Candidatus Sericytochromatia bacterium]|nr:DUF4381 family protein [Candidatus Sericytochromatia bacterium]